MDCGTSIVRPPGRTGLLPKRCPPCAKQAKYRQSQASKDRSWTNSAEYREKERKRRREQAARWRAANPERARERDRNWKRGKWASDPEWRETQILNRISNRYNIPVDDYRALIERQENKCAICRAEPVEGERLHIDHDHGCCPKRSSSCGRCIRGLLCAACNNGLGRFTDNPAVLRTAARYLEDFASG